MKGCLIIIGLCFVFALGIESNSSAAPFTLGDRHDRGLVCATAMISGNAMLLAQQSRATSSSDSSSGTSYGGRGLGRFIKLAAIGIIALVGWFLKWTLID